MSQVEREEKIMIEQSAKQAGNQWMIPYPCKKDPNNKVQVRQMGTNDVRSVKDPLTPKELHEAELFWIKEVQRSLNYRVEKGEFRSLSPFREGQNLTFKIPTFEVQTMENNPKQCMG